MSRVVLVNFRLDEKDKVEMEKVCNEIGISMSAAFSVFAKKVAREKRIPFELSVNPFYVEENMKRFFSENNEANILSLETIKKMLIPIAEKYEIKSITIFGSYARNEASPQSDVDIMIDGGNYQGLIEYMNMINEMKGTLKKDVDVVTLSVLKKSKLKSDIYLLGNIEKEGVKIYGC